MDNAEILQRAKRLIEAAILDRLAETSVAVYRRTARRLLRRGRTKDGRFIPLTSRTKNSFWVERAAWRRLAYVEFSSAVIDLRDHLVEPCTALQRIKLWLEELDAVGDPWVPPVGGPPSSRSKRHALATLPTSWMNEIWSKAVSVRCRHLDALAVLIVSGCRAQEICHGCAVRTRGDGTLDIALHGAKVREGRGQPWRLLTAVADGPAALHLLALAEAAGGTARVRAACSPNALSMRIAGLAGDRFGRRISAHDFRHQRAADVRTATGDAALCARWLGHAATSTGRYYGRLPRSAGVLGPWPVAADAPRNVRVRARTGKPAPEAAGAGNPAAPVEATRQRLNGTTSAAPARDPLRL